MWSEYDFNKIPFDQIEGLGQRSLVHRDVFSVSWILNRFCNYSCSYCWPGSNTKERDFRSLDNLKHTVNEIKRQARDRGFNSFHFAFTGGEPSAHPHYLELLRHYSSDKDSCNYLSVHTTSNLSQGKVWLNSYAEITKEFNRSNLTASYHSEFADEKKFIEKAVYLQSLGVRVTVNVVMVPSRFDDLLALAKRFSSENVNVTLKPQMDTSKENVLEDGYSAEMLDIIRGGMPQRYYLGIGNAEVAVSTQPSEVSPDQEMQFELVDDTGKTWFMDQAERLNTFEFNKFKGWECSAGFRSCAIHEPSGHVKRGHGCLDQVLGHVETGFDLFNKVALCQTSNACTCSADSKIPKRKTRAAYKLFPDI